MVRIALPDDRGNAQPLRIAELLAGAARPPLGAAGIPGPFPPGRRAVRGARNTIALLQQAGSFGLGECPDLLVQMSAFGARAGVT